MTIINLGSRRSTLARKQTSIAIAALKECIAKNNCLIDENDKQNLQKFNRNCIDFIPIFIQASGDEDQVHRVLPAKFGQKGMFTHDLEILLDAGKIDVAVHSMKDMPAEVPPQYGLAVLPRSSPFDVLLTKDHKHTFYTLPPNSIIGTSSARRRSIALSLRHDLRISEIRGNVETRIRKLQEGDVDGVILAMAGLMRLGLEDIVSEILVSTDFIPAPAQGVIAMQYRLDNQVAKSLCESVDHLNTRIAVATERAFVAEIGATCGTPIAVYSELVENNTRLWMHVGCYAPDGRDKVIFSRDLVVDSLKGQENRLHDFACELANYAKGLGVVELMSGG